MREFSPGVSWHAPYGTKAGTEFFCNTEFFCFVARGQQEKELEGVGVTVE
jgi:hypothetical protein